MNRVCKKNNATSQMSDSGLIQIKNTEKTEHRIENKTVALGPVKINTQGSPR